MIKLKDLIPINLQEEKERFFDNNYHYNPQFEYHKHISRKELEKYGKPKLRYLLLASRIVRKYRKQESRIETAKKATKEILQDKIENYLKEYNLENTYKVSFSDQYISRIAVNFKEKLIKVREPIIIDENEIEAILNHEIGTHALRQENYEHQDWYKKKKKYKFNEHIKTEEGLAIINEMLNKEHPIAYKSAVNYLAVNVASHGSFVRVFKFFNKYWQDPERAWIWTLKKKRGVRDTSKKIAFSKDLVYFEGFVKVIKYLKKNNFDPTELYYGKLDLDDLNKAKEMNPSYKPLLPKFFTDNPEIYKEKVKRIAKENLL